MTAPLVFFSGAPVAQNVCATGDLTLKGKGTGAKRATAPAPLAQAQPVPLPNRAGQAAPQ
jgi:hypothetical protein